MTTIVLSIMLVIVSITLIIVYISLLTYRKRVRKLYDPYHDFLEEQWTISLDRSDISGARAYSKALSRAEFEYLRSRLGLSNENTNEK